jgi:hypothetical protein
MSKIEAVLNEIEANPDVKTDKEIGGYMDACNTEYGAKSPFKGKRMVDGKVVKDSEATIESDLPKDSADNEKKAAAEKAAAEKAAVEKVEKVETVESTYGDDYVTPYNSVPTISEHLASIDKVGQAETSEAVKQAELHNDHKTVREEIKAGIGKTPDAQAKFAAVYQEIEARPNTRIPQDDRFSQRYIGDSPNEPASKDQKALLSYMPFDDDAMTKKRAGDVIEAFRQSFPDLYTKADKAVNAESTKDKSAARAESYGIECKPVENGVSTAVNTSKTVVAQAQNQIQTAMNRYPSKEEIEFNKMVSGLNGKTNGGHGGLGE